MFLSEGAEQHTSIEKNHNKNVISSPVNAQCDNYNECIECEVRDSNPRSRAWEARTLTSLG